MVITRRNVIHVGRNLSAAHSILVVECAPVLVAPQDALSEHTPVSRETLPSIRTGPLGHAQITALNVVTKGPRPCLL